MFAWMFVSCGPALEEGNYKFELDLDDADCGESEYLETQSDNFELKGELRLRNDIYELKIDLSDRFGPEIGDFILEGEDKYGKIVLSYQNTQPFYETADNFDANGNPIEIEPSKCEIMTTWEMELDQIEDGGEKVEGKMSVSVLHLNCSADIILCKRMTYGVTGGLD